MGLNDTPLANRIQIGFFGRRNAGKSSVVNAVTGQELSVVSDIRGTTTDPVCKTMELLPLGPVAVIDTPGYDDVGTLGEQRVRRTRQVLDRIDLAVLVVDALEGAGKCEQELLQLFEEKNIPFLTVYNKSDLLTEIPAAGRQELYVSALKGQNIYELKERLGAMAPKKGNSIPLVADLIQPGDFVVLVTPIDSAAPKGRLILPQQQVLRDIVDAKAVAVVTGVDGLTETLGALGKRPALVVTDSQVFGQVSEAVPQELPLTSFSVLMARYKGILDMAVAGAAALDRLKDGDRVLIAEGCTHHRQCEDIGTVKLPRWLREYTGRKLEFSFCSGTEFPEELSSCALVLHCGGCMLNEREMRSRMERTCRQGIPVTNYGVAIAHVHGILKRSIAMFPGLLEEL